MNNEGEQPALPSRTGPPDPQAASAESTLHPCSDLNRTDADVPFPHVIARAWPDLEGIDPTLDLRDQVLGSSGHLLIRARPTGVGWSSVE